MTHYNTFREQLAIAHPAFGYALWEPDPGELYPVEVGDVGFIRQGKFHRLFNALLPANHESHQRFGVPERHEPLRLSVPNHIDHGTLYPNNFCSYGVTVESGGSGVFAVAPPTPDSAEVSFSCTRKHGAALSLPVVARREDTLSQAHFGTWITRHIDSWFAFSQRHGLGIEMEDIVLVTGCHRTRSWSNIAFYESQADSRISLRVQVPDVGTTVHWRVLSQRIHGAVLSHGPSGENLPENQCLFIRGFRVKRLFWIIPRLKGAAQPQPDAHGDDPEPEVELVSIPSVTESRDPLHVLLEYIAARAPDCDMALVHDDDMERILGVGDGAALEALQPDVVMDYLQRSKPEIGVMSDSWAANKESPRVDEKGTTIAMLSEQLHSLYPTASVPLPSHSPGGVTDTKEMANCRGLSNRPSNFSGSGSAITESEIYVDDLVNIIEGSSFDDFARSPYRSNPETYSSDSETIASGGTSDIDFDTDVEFEGIAPDDPTQPTFSLEQHTDWYVADPNKRQQETGSSVIHVTNVGSDDDEDSDVLETGSRELALAAIRRGGIAIRMPFPRNRSFHASHPDLVPREDITTAVSQPSHNDAEGDTSVNATSPNRDQPSLPPANSAGISPTDDSGEHMRQGMSLDKIMSVGNLVESLDKRKSKDKEEGKDEDFDFTRIIDLPSSSLNVVPRAEADDTTGQRRPSTATLDDSFAGSLRRNDPDHALRRDVWSFTRQRGRVSQPPRRPDGNPRHWDVWRCSQIGQIRIERATLRSLDPDKPSHQRLNAEHDVDPDSANTLGGPTAVVHRHSRALAFSIFRNYSLRNHRSGRTPNSTETVSARTPKSKETRTPVMSTHDVILLATKRIQEQFTTTKSTTKLEKAAGRLDTRREPNPIHLRRSPQDWLATSPQQKPPTPHHIANRSRLEGPDSQTSNIQGTTLSHVSGSSLDLASITTFTSSASTSQSVSSTTTVLSSLESSSAPERQLSPHDEAEEDGGNESVNPISRTSQAEALATLDNRANDQLKNEQVPAPTTRRSHDRFQRSISSRGSSAPRTLSSSMNPINPPWMNLAPHSMKEERDSKIQDLRSSFKDVGMLSLTRSKGSARIGRKGKGKNKDVLTQVPDDSLFMLLPLWPHETDPASTVGEQRQGPPRDQEQNLYLLVYYVPFDEQSEAKKRSRVRLQKGERERQHPTPLFDLRSGFKVIGQLIAHSDLNGSGIRLPARGLSVTGPLEEAELGITPRDVHSDDVVMGACLDGSGTAIEFFPEALEKLGLCVPRTEASVQHQTDPAEPVVEQPLTAIGRAAVEVAWLGCMALMTFYGPQSQGPA